MFGQPKSARHDLETAVANRPGSGVAHALLAQALLSEAMICLYDPQEHLDLARYAFMEAMIGVRTSHSDNIHAAVASLDSHGTLYLALR